MKRIAFPMPGGFASFSPAPRYRLQNTTCENTTTSCTSILPEFYASKFASDQKSGLFRILVGVERASSRFASHVIIANDIWRERLVSRSLSRDKCTVVLNSPDRSIFRRTGNGHPQSGKFLMLYPGSLNWHQGIDIAIRAFAKISKL